MPVWRKRKRKFKINWVHFQAIAVLVVYLVFSKTVLIKSLASGSDLIFFFGPLTYGLLAGLVFLYLFSHEDFFPLAHEIEREEKKAEKKWESRLSHHGKVFICLVIGTLTSPILGALAVRFLIHKHTFGYKFLIILVAEVFSTAINLGLIKGALGILF